MEPRVIMLNQYQEWSQPTKAYVLKLCQQIFEILLYQFIYISIGHWLQTMPIHTSEMEYYNNHHQSINQAQWFKKKKPGGADLSQYPKQTCRL